LLIGDLHLTEQPRDAYRFRIFKWIREQQATFSPKATIFMGDLTDKKDKHASTLVNRIMDELSNLDKFYMLMGNHDYIDPSQPFFKFMGGVFMYEPTMINKLLFIPHTRSESEFARACKSFNSVSLDYVFCHQTFEGAIAETGVRLSGYSQAHIDQLQPRLGIYAGDVHRPQRAANVVYVGAPYHIRFGDDFDPRCILLEDDGTPKNLYFETVRKWALTVRCGSDIAQNKRLFKGDQAKVTIELAREEAVDWRTHKKDVLEAAKVKGLELFGVVLKVNSSTPRKVTIADVKSRTPYDILIAYCKTENVASQIKEAGQALLER